MSSVRLFRSNTLIVDSGGAPAWGAAYDVYAMPAGAQVTTGLTGTVLTVASGHGFSVNDKLIKNSDTSIYRTVDAVTATTITVNSAMTVAIGDVLTNLGPDTGASTPNFDGSPVSMYQFMDGTGAYTDKVTANSQGVYEYWHDAEDRVWELVLDSTGAVVTTLMRVHEPSTFAPVLTDSTRGAAGKQGRIIFNSGDGNLNIDDGTNWINVEDGLTT